MNHTTPRRPLLFFLLLMLTVMVALTTIACNSTTPPQGSTDSDIVTETATNALTEASTQQEDPTESPTETPAESPTESPTEAPTEVPTEALTEAETINPAHAEAAATLDFVVEVETGREIRVLQITDPQIIDSAQQRSSGRLDANSTAAWATDKMESVCFQYIRKAVERVQPDLILVTGDLVYGEFDDAGTSLQALIALMDGFEIPWAPIFGNHDNESKKGANWQCEQLTNSPYCLFAKGDTDGNGNYSIGVMQGGELVRVFYMMDSNGCKKASSASDNHVTTTAGLTAKQLLWLKTRMDNVATIMGEIVVPSSVCFHIPTKDFVRANQQYLDQKSSYTIHVNVTGPATDFGSMQESGGIKGAYEAPSVGGMTFLQLLQAYNVDSVFAGHSHQVNTSVMYEGIRWTMGLKTGTYDRYTAQELGGTQITFDKDNFHVKHVYFNLRYEENLESKRPTE